MTYAGTLTAAAMSIGGYLILASVGLLVSSSIEDGSFAGLAIAALTLTVIAPAGALLGAYIGHRRYRGTRLSQNSRGVLFTAAILVTTVAAGTYWSSSRLLIVSVALLGISTLLIVRVALVERSTLSVWPTITPGVRGKR